MNKTLEKINSEVFLYFIRHGQSAHNEKHIIAGRMETPLTKLGKNQAGVTGVYLKKTTDISCILCSPIGRAKNTALIIKDLCKKTKKEILLQECNFLVEIDAGDFENKKVVDIEKQNPKLFELFKKDSWEAVPHAETIKNLILRTKKIWEKIVQLVKEGHTQIAIVSHGGIMQWIFKTSFGFTGEHVRAWAPIVKVSNCGMYCLHIEKTVNKQEQSQSGHATWTMLNHLVYKK